MKNWIVLKHVLSDFEGKENFHYDFLLESDNAFLTWRFSAFDQPAPQISDHRLAFRDYEGPISNNRGFVKRLYKGKLEWILKSDSLYKFLLDGFSYELKRTEYGWVLSPQILP